MDRKGGTGKGGKLMAVIADEDTCTGFLLGGIGELNNKREPNFLVVDKGADITCSCTISGNRVIPIGSMEMASLWLFAWLSGVSMFEDMGRIQRHCPHRIHLVPGSADNDTSLAEIEESFRSFTNRNDIAVILINQSIAEMIRHILDGYTSAIPAVLEIPSKDHPYDPSKDSILRRARGMFNAEDFR